jgi:hypothetical protein
VEEVAGFVGTGPVGYGFGELSVRWMVGSRAKLTWREGNLVGFDGGIKAKSEASSKVND